MIRDDPTAYGGYASAGIYKAAPVVDPSIFGKATYPMPDYMLPTVKRVDTPVNKTIQYYALGLALSQLDSTWDNTLDFATYTNVTLKGANDDVEYAPGTTVSEFVHPTSRLVYRAAQIDPVRPGIGVTVIKELNQLVGVAGTPGTLPAKYGTATLPTCATDVCYPFFQRTVAAGEGAQPLPDWYTGKALKDAAQAAAQQNTDTSKAADLQKAYEAALQNFNIVDVLLSFKVDLLGDIRTFRHAFSP